MNISAISGRVIEPIPLTALISRKQITTHVHLSAYNGLRKKILSAGTLAGLNDEDRAILLTVIDTGARPSEICNLYIERIHFDAAVPHIEIAPYNEKGKKRKIKTRSSIRKIPLIGMVLAVLQKHHGGFPRHQDKENSLSATRNKYFRENGLFLSRKHTIYSFRHLFEDRMKEAGIDHETALYIDGTRAGASKVWFGWLAWMAT